MPGPGTYNPSDVDSTQGGYIISNFRNTGNVKFIKPNQVALSMRSRTPMNHRTSKWLLQALARPHVSLPTGPNFR